MMAEDTLTHEQALTMLNDHLDEEVFVGLTMSSPSGDFSVMRMAGALGKLMVGETPSRDAYTVGGEAFMLPPLPGTVSGSEMGLEWRLAEGLTLRINWGNPATTGGE
jgi:hypothetical protein